jgi:hypothetical protein
MRFHLSAVESQEEYEVVLDIIDENKSNIAKMFCKISFVWSYHSYYQDLINKTEKQINNHNLTIQRSNKILEILSGIIILIFKIHLNLTSLIVKIRHLLTNHKTLRVYMMLVLQGLLGRLYLNLLRLSLKKRLVLFLISRTKVRLFNLYFYTDTGNSVWVEIIKKMVFLILVTSYLTTFQIASFINIIIPGYMMLIILFLIFFDVLWIIFALQVTYFSNQNIF